MTVLISMLVAEDPTYLDDAEPWSLELEDDAGPTHLPRVGDFIDVFQSTPQDTLTAQPVPVRRVTYDADLGYVVVDLGIVVTHYQGQPVAPADWRLRMSTAGYTSPAYQPEIEVGIDTDDNDVQEGTDA